MAFEKHWPSIAPRALSSNGTMLGIVNIASTTGFRVKQTIVLENSAVPNSSKSFQVKQVLSRTQLVVGLVDNKIPGKPEDISEYTVALGATISAAKQDKNKVPGDDHYLAVYEGDPVAADRVIFVDPDGDFYDEGNPLPIAFDGTVSVGKVQVEGENGNTIEPNIDGSVNVNIIQAPNNNQIKNTYGEAYAVASGVETTIATYMVPLVLTQALLQRVSVCGENVARYQVLVNGVVIDTRRTYYGGSFNEYFEFCISSGDGTVLQPGDIVTVRVLHNRPGTADFQSRIQVFEII